MSQWLGLDIGGANIKSAWGSSVRSQPFPLWRQPKELAGRLRSLVSVCPPSAGLAVTMTGELADCFPTRRAGVRFIVAAALEIAGDCPVRFRTTDGRWFVAAEAIAEWEKIAAANWQASAAYANRFLKHRSGFFVDIGSTTTDIIPISEGNVAAQGQTDIERLATGELFYGGVQRTPICSVCQHLQLNGQTIGVARELFATTQDVFLVSNEVEEDLADINTADGRPATRSHAEQRLARMVCSDAEILGTTRIEQMANQVRRSLADRIEASLNRVIDAHPNLPLDFVICGQGEWLGRSILNSCFEGSNIEVTGVSKLLNSDISRSMAAYSVAMLAAEEINTNDCPSRLPAPDSTRKRSLRVIKIGGSLFGCVDLPERINTWIAKQSPATNVWVVGGGDFVDQIRRWEQVHTLDSQTAHWVAMDLMSVTTKLIHNWFDEWPIVKQLNEVEGGAETGNCFFDVKDWMLANRHLPESWHVTSDSCAALLATHLDADEVVLLKSRLTKHASIEELAGEDLVDVEFATLARNLPATRIVNLRDDEFAEVVVS